MSDNESQEILVRLAQDRIKNNYMIDPQFFMTPDMGDYMVDDMSLKNIKTIEEKLNIYGQNGADATYFIESPYNTVPGYYDGVSVFVIKATPLIGPDETRLRSYDGDTIYFKMSSIVDGAAPGAKIDINGKTYNGFKDYASQSLFEGNADSPDFTKFGLRFLGINAPEIAHYYELRVPKESNSLVKKESKTIASIKGDSNYVYDKGVKRADEDATTINFVKFKDDGVWSEEITCIVDEKNSDVFIYTYVGIDDSDPNDQEKNDQGLNVQDFVRTQLSSCSDMCIVVDAKTLSHNKSDNDAYVAANSLQGLWNKFWGKVDYSYMGYNFWGQDSYKRFLGCVYIKKDLDGYGSVWINLSKYILANYSKVVVDPDYTSNPTKNQNYGYVSDAFKMWTYLRDNQPYADALFDISSQDASDRNKIQKDIMGSDLELLKEFTVAIGDCLFIVPPTSIRCVSQTNSERIPLLRAKGAMTKSGEKAERILEMTLYFNDSEGINGVPYATKLPNGEPVTYYMNGLRSLISQFKFTPFLPIENTYINQTLNIEAVALVNLQVTTISGYPKTIAATLTLSEFNYRIYMPELPVPSPEDSDYLTRNMFAATINYQAMRWYYQRAIMRGNNVKEYPFDSKDYLDATFGTQTALQPMEFVDSDAQFYIIDKNWLDKQLQVKLAAMSRTESIKNRPTLTENAKAWQSQLGRVYTSLDSVLNDTEFKSRLKKLNKEDGILIADSPLINEAYGSGIYRTELEKATVDGDIPTVTHNNDSVLENYLNPLITAFKTALEKQSSIASGVEFAERFDEGTIDDTVSIMIKLNVSRQTVSSDAEIDDLLINLMGEKTYNNKESDDSLTKYYDKNKSCVYLRLIAKFSANGHKVTSEFRFDTSTPGYKFLGMCAGTTAFVTNEDVDNIDGTSDYTNTQGQISGSMTDMKESLDYENTDTLRYVPYAIDNMIIKSISCVYGNTMSRITLQAQDGYAPQYAGGQDTVIEMIIETADSNAVALLNALPVMSAQYVRDYRQILPCWPVRLDSELTRLLGVNEVLIENVDATTIPNYPGHYSISIRMSSVDRTMRNKEALKKIDVPLNAGTLSTDGKQSVMTKSYFDLNNTLSKAEVYPDLELPTIKELSDNGFEFIRYKTNTSNKVFPDPDFYFVYGWVLGSEIFRNSIINSLKDELSIPDYKINDKFSNEFTITPIKSKGYIYKASNAETESNKNLRSEFDKLFDKTSASSETSSDPNTDTSQLKPSELISAMFNLDAYGSWNIADTVKCIFREKQYDDTIYKNSSNKDENSEFFEKKIKQRADAIKDLIDKELKTEISTDRPDYLNYTSDQIEKGIKDCVWKYFWEKDGVGYKILCLLGSMDGSENLSSSWWPWGDKTTVCNNIVKIAWAAAAAASGQKEYEDKMLDDRWKPVMMTESTNSEGKPVPYALKSESGTNSGIYQVASMDDALEKGITFGPFQMKLYTKEEYKSIIGNAEDTNGESRMLIDPAYKGKTRSNLKPLLTAVMKNPYTATEMFIRNSLLWLKKMANDSLIVSLYDLVYSQAISNISDEHVKANMTAAANASGYTKNNEGVWVPTNDKPNSRGLTKEMLDQAEQAKKDYLNGKNTEPTEKEKKTVEENNTELLDRLQESMEENKVPFGTGKIFVPMLLALTSGDDYIYSLIKERNYDTLNSLIRSVPLPNTAFANGQEASSAFRRFVLAMCGYDVFDDLSKIGTTKNKNIGEIFAELLQEKVYLEAAEDPRQYLMHSFYDMIVNDKRGRMLRAFPTFYMLFVDEGREIGLWKMHDNFYNMSSISEIQVTKSRKIAADTARIVMTNFYNTYDTTDEDAYLVNDYGIMDVFNSVFSPRTYFMKEEAKRLQQADIERAKLVPGTRIHLRMGYGSNASNLPIIFNGCIAEVGVGQTIEIVAQGDGIELTNPILSKADAEDIQNQDKFIIHELWDDWMVHGATPRTILGSFLMTKGGFLNKTVFNLSDGRFFNKNPYGISHFGDPDYKPIFQSGEVVQNIYEGAAQPSWGEDNAESKLLQFYGTESAPRLSTHVFGKSYWDMMHICRSACPDYMTSVVPFGLRSSIFFGPPRAYCAYEYVKDSNNIVKEKRKPFQQYHIYNSYSDIIVNNVKSSNKEVKTCAVGMYTGYGWFGSENSKKVGPMWVDFDIYPENQKTMTVDTQFLAKGSVVGDILPFINMFQNEFGKANSKHFQGGDKIAWRMTASALKDSIKDMYDGELIVLGDPSVKPYDRMWIHDSYEQIQGAAEVEAVVHNFTVQTGYTTSVYADCITTIDDRYEQISHHWGNDVVQKCLLPYTSIVLATCFFSHIGKPVMKVLGSYALGTGEKAVSFVNAVAGILGNDEIVRNEAYLKKFQSVSKFFGVNTISTKFNSLLKNIETYKKSLAAFDGVKDLGKLSTKIDDLASAFNKMNANDIISLLNDSGKSEVSTAVKELGTHQARVASELAKFSDEGLILQIKTLAEESGTSAEEIATLYGKISGGIKTPDDLKDLSKLIKFASTNSTNIAEKDAVLAVIKTTAQSAKTASATISVGVEASTAAIEAAGVIVAETSTAAVVASAILPALVTLGITVAVSSFAYEYIERWMRNLQVLQIFPLKKNGFVWTAGLNGSKGVIVGSPSYDNDSNSIEGFLANILGDKPNQPWYSSVLRSLSSSEMINIANNYKRGLDIPIDVDDNSSMNTTISDLLSAVNVDEIKKQNSYRAMMMQGRVQDLSSQDGKLSYVRTAIMDSSQESSIPESMMLLLGPEQIVLNSYKDKGYLTLIHEEPSARAGVKSIQKHFLASGKNNGNGLDVPALQESDGTIDLPFLRQDAYYVLTHILSTLDNTFSKLPKGEGFEKHHVTIESCLRINEPSQKRSWSNTGYSFTINTADYDLESILKLINDETKADMAKINSNGSSFFIWSMKSNNTASILIYPPKNV